MFFRIQANFFSSLVSESLSLFIEANKLWDLLSFYSLNFLFLEKDEELSFCWELFLEIGLTL